MTLRIDYFYRTMEVRPIEAIPFLLAGPIVRRVEPMHVYIWLTTRESVQTHVLLNSVIRNESDNSVGYDPLRTSTESTLIQSGKNLYTYLLKVSPKSDCFPLDSLIGYNITFKTQNNQFDLGDLDLLSKGNPNSIVYGELSYPTFIIQSNSDTNILYGSCQKPHGKEQSVLTSADAWIQRNTLNLTERPTALFLMGDQIYADDVADPFFYKLQDWAKRIIGEDSNQIKETEPRLKSAPFLKGMDQVHGRQYVMNTFGKFTSNHASNHLIRFSEYATMYLMVLGPSLWEANEENTFPSFEELLLEDALYVIYPKRKKRKRKKEIKKHYKQYKEQIEDLDGFITSLPAIRRILANTPTFMIFDDHDITDDWNISQEWKDNVDHSKLGEHVIANGLSAYWLFQGWGNDPEHFRLKFPYIKLEFRHFLSNSFFRKEWVDSIQTYHSWSFVAPTNPQALFLDIRTIREYDYKPKPLRVGRVFKEGRRSPQLIGKEGWQIVSKTLEQSDWIMGNPLIVVSPTPLYGLGIIESFLNRFVYPLRVLGLPVRYALDFEAWKYNGSGFNRFIQQLFKWNPNPCIILSGDVHYANAVRSTVYLNKKRKLSIHQFTSSPIHNMSFSGIWGMLLKLVVWFNSQNRKRKVIYRSYDAENNLSIGSKTIKHHKKLKWYEEIKYLSPTNGQVMHTENNIGLLKIARGVIKNMLFKKNRVVTYKNSLKQKNEETH